MDVIRNPYEIEKFANSVQEFEQNMKSVCSKMQGDIDNAAGSMVDSTGQDALGKLGEIIEDILASLPNASNLEGKLRTISKYGKEYLDIKY